MDPVVEEDNPYVNMRADLQERMLRVTWKQYPTSAIYRSTLDKAVEWINAHELIYYYSDNRARGPILHDDEMWVYHDWAPRMGNTTLIRSALVQSPDFFNATTLDRIVSTVMKTISIPIHFFRTPEEAHHWLMTGEEVVPPDGDLR